MKDFVRHVINRKYAGDDAGEIIEYSDDRLNLYLMNKLPALLLSLTGMAVLGMRKRRHGRI